MLAPTLQPGDIVVMDNLGSHKGDRIRQILKRHGVRRLFLPPYSPDLNPIEQVFSKLKRLLRKAEARTLDAICHNIAGLLAHFDADECTAYLRNSGYAST